MSKFFSCCTILSWQDILYRPFPILVRILVHTYIHGKGSMMNGKYWNIGQNYPKEDNSGYKRKGFNGRLNYVSS